MTRVGTALRAAIAEAAHRAGASRVGLVDVGPADGPNLAVDGGGGEPPRVVGGRPLPDRAFPEVVSRAGIEHGALAEALAAVPADALPVVTTTWALSGIGREDRLRFLQRLDAAATLRTVAWVSVEGVGVAPGVPTMGDRPASGHSIVGVALFEHRTLRAEAVGRCWQRGAVVSWLAD